jgi:polyphosphate kinase
MHNSLDSNSETFSTSPTRKIPLDSPEFYLNRELSWIRFNARVLEEARDLWHPLLERVKFIAICGSNLDEFFMTRIPRLIKKINTNSEEKSMDGMTAMEQVQATRKEILPLIENHVRCWRDELLPALAKEDIRIHNFEDLPRTKKEALQEYLKTTILPSLKLPKPGINSGDIENLHVNLLIQKNNSSDTCFVIDVPSEKFGRLIRVPRSKQDLKEVALEDVAIADFVLLEDLLANNLSLFFPDEKTLKAYPFRLTRNGEIDIIMDESADFLSLVQKSVQNRKSGFPTRLEFDKALPAALRMALAKAFELPSYLLYEVEAPLGLVDLWQLLKINRPDLKDKTFLPSISPLLTPERNVMEAIAKRDVVLYHPYDAFEVIIELLKEAALDKNVVEISITMYRMDHRSPVVEALLEAAKRGKKVTAVVELKAKFDEENNILLVSKLREGGVKTAYNFPNFKVHAKLCLIAKKDKTGFVRFSHIGSGNYNSVTAKIYGDIGYLTARPEVGLELEELFDVLINGVQEKESKRLLVSPKTLKTEILNRIDREIAFHKKTGKGYLAFKLNHLEEKEVIQALYKASMAGVKIDLNVRGLCCLKPGIKGISENISVVSIVGRVLEHARIYYFRDGTEDEVLVGSSDLMFRNLNERIEVLFSVPDATLRQAILEDMLKIHLRDNVKARKLQPDGTYVRVTPKEGEERINSQLWLIQHRGIWNERAK